MEYETRPAYEANKKQLIVCKTRDEENGSWLCEFYNRERATSRKERREVWKWQKNPCKNGWVTDEELAKYEADDSYLVKKKRQKSADSVDDICVGDKFNNKRMYQSYCRYTVVAVQEDTCTCIVTPYRWGNCTYKKQADMRMTVDKERLLQMHKQSR